MDNIDRGKEKKENNAWWQPALAIFFRLSAWITIPVLLGAFVGKWLDRKYDSEPWLFLASVGFAFLISMFGLVKNAVIEFKKIEKECRSKEKNKES